MRDDRITINVGPAKRASKRALNILGWSFGGAAMIIMILLGLAALWVFTGVIYWVSDLGYSVHWVVGLPIRLFAFMMFISAVFATIGSLFQILAVTLGALVGMITGKGFADD